MIGLSGHLMGERATVLSNFLLYIKKKEMILQEGRKPLGVGKPLVPLEKGSEG